MRIIAGRFKGRRLDAPTWPGLRPTSDKLRETLFNVLQPEVAGARVLDGFAGTGAVGLEALSRGASHVTFVDKDRRACRLVADNLRHCGVAEGYTVVRAAVTSWLGRASAEAGPDAVASDGFDIVFVDPPYDEPDLQAIVAAGMARVAPGGVLVLEQASRREPPAGAARTLTSGDSMLAFYRPLQPGRVSLTAAAHPRIAIYPGSFDPLTNGHVDIIRRGSQLFDRIVIAVAVNPEKAPLFTPAERVAIAREVFAQDRHVEVDSFSDLLVDYARRRGASVIVRGLRAVSDFEYELQMALMNRHLSPALETVFMMPGEAYTYVSSRLVKEVFALGGPVEAFVPTEVERRLAQKRLALAADLPGTRQI